MENQAKARHRRRFWHGCCLLFVFWYMLLYGFDWSSFPVIASMSGDQQTTLQSSLSISESASSPHHKDQSSSSDNTPILESDDGPDQKDQSPSSDNAILESDNVDVSDQKNQSPSSSNAIPESDDVKNVGMVSKLIYDSTENQRENTLKSVNNLYTEKDAIMDLASHEEEKRQQREEDNDVEDKRRKQDPCAGRYIYIHDIPSRFNTDYVKQCKLLNKWENMCPYFANDGFGEPLGNPQGLFMPSGWYATNQFSLEVIFHNRMKQYGCLTNDSSTAAAIFIPYYPGLDVSRYLWDESNSWRKDEDSLDLFKLLREKPEWKAMGGRDHFLVSGRITWDFRRTVDNVKEWGSRLMALPEAQNMTMITIESSPWNNNDFAIPYPTYFHPSSDHQVFEWQNRMRKQRRRSLFCFAGAPRPNMQDSIRDEIMAQCAASRRKCRMMECKNDRRNCMKPVNIMKMFQNSVFCLQPPGDSFTRRSTFDSILAGCIPVFFTPGSAYVQYLWHLPNDFESYSVLIPEGDVKQRRVRIDNVLSQIPRSRVAQMRENVIKLIQKVVYSDPRSGSEMMDDAFELTIKGVVERVEMLKRVLRQRRNYSDELDLEFSWKHHTFGTTEPHEWDHYFKRN